MKFLIIDTSRREALIALVEDGRVLIERRWEADRQLGRDLLVNLDEALGEAAWKLDDLQRIAVHKGPGHYSALRSGVVTATVMAGALGVDLVSVEGDNLADLVSLAVQGESVEIIESVYN